MPTTRQPTREFVERIDRRVRGLLAHTLVLISVTLLLVVTWQVISRYALGAPSAVTEELSRLLMVSLMLLGSAKVFALREHVAIELMPNLVHGSAQRTVRDLITLAGGAGGVVLITGSLGLLENASTLGQALPTLGISMAWLFAIALMSGALILWFALVDLLTRSAPSEAGASQAP